MPDEVLACEVPTVSVLIPTYNRADVLPLCLAHLERQTFPDFEVVIVDDGSSDGTAEWLAGYVRSTTLSIRTARQENAGAARARNVAVGMARGKVSVILGDDILCSPELVETHHRFHQEHPEDAVAGLGLTRWCETGQVVTPFMRWMDESGTQFAYGDLLRGTKPNWRHFYTSNLSLKTEMLRKYPFIEAFPGCGMEDMELGYRLEQREGMKVTFLREALAQHIHPIDFSRACRRAFQTGLSLQVFDRLWPDRPAGVHGWLHRGLKEILVQNAWLLGSAAGVAGWVTERWCPNPLIRPVLAWHVEVARRRVSDPS